jgi:hypothetical protein
MNLYKHTPKQTARVAREHSKPPFSQVIIGELHKVYFVLYNPHTNQSAELFGWLRPYKEYYQMARIKYGVDFVNLKLTDEDKEAFSKWVDDNNGDILTYLEQLIGSGYKLSLNEDEENHCFIAAVTGGQDNRENRNKCLISRAPDLLEVLQMALYKHFVVCNAGDWGDTEKQDMTWG